MVEFIEVDELDTLRKRIGEFLLSKNPVRIDGAAPGPILLQGDHGPIEFRRITLTPL